MALNKWAIADGGYNPNVGPVKPSNPTWDLLTQTGRNIGVQRGAAALKAGKTNENVVDPGRRGDGGNGPTPPPVTTPPGSDGPSASDIAAANAAAELAKAKKAGKDQTAKENKATQDIIDSLINSVKGYKTGYETQLKNADAALKAALQGINANYAAAVADYAETSDSNKEDEASKTAANLQNRARERMSLLEQAASLGAGGTDQMRAALQAFLNADANQQEIARAFYDTERSINSQIAGANSQAEASRRSAWNQNQEAYGQATNDYYKNLMDVWTNVQRTAAANTNIDSDYSTEFVPDYGGKDPLKQADKYAGKTYKTKKKDEEWYGSWKGRTEGEDTRLGSTSRAGTVQINAPKEAEGATLRREW